jgi:hypothetical protein
MWKLLGMALVGTLGIVPLAAAQVLVAAGPEPGSTNGGSNPYAAAKTPQESLNIAIRLGDTVKIAGLLADAKSNPTELAQLANILLASAQATQKAGNSAGAAILAAFAVSSGGLTGANATAALSIVNLSPTAQALISNPNAPATGSSSLSATLTNSGTIVVVNTIASPSQATSGSPS